MLLLVLLIVASSVIQLPVASSGNILNQANIVYSSDNDRIRGIRDISGFNIIIGGLFPVHKDAGGNQCGNYQKHGVNRVEAMLFALDMINSDGELLPNITIGYDIRDTCNVEQIGLEEAAELIVANQQRCELTLPNITDKLVQSKVIGLVGAAASPVTIPIAGLSRLFAVPQISYSSTSALLDNRERYSYFYRTIPSDTLETKAIIDLMLHFDWTYISTIFSRDSYGQSGIDGLHALAAEHGICIDLKEGIDEDFSESDYIELANKLEKSVANVVVLYASRMNAESLFVHINPNRKFTWIATSAWAQLVTETALQNQNLINITAGLFATIPAFNHVSKFESYLSNLTNGNNTRNPWFNDVYGSCVVNDNDTCSSAPSMVQDYAVPSVIDAVYTFAHALNNYIIDHCDNQNKGNFNCFTTLNNKLNGSVLLDYIKNINFTSITEDHVIFDHEGNIQSTYDIKNFQANYSSEGELLYNLVTIGSWDIRAMNTSDALMLRSNADIQFGINSQRDIIREQTESVCGKCSMGQYKRMIPSSCCGLCENCLGQNFSNSSTATSCTNCSVYGEMWGKNPTVGSSDCVPINKVFLSFQNPWSIVIMLSSIIGLILLVVVIVIFALFWKTPVITSSGRESMVLILIGIFIAFIAAFVYVSPPSLGICTLQRILLWLCSSLIFGSVTIKIVRVTRIFVFQKSSLKRLGCMSTQYQILFTLLIVVGQLVIVFISLLSKHPGVLMTLRLNGKDNNDTPEIVVTCVTDHLLVIVSSVLYETGLSLISAVLGILSFKSPENFNEARALCCSAFAQIIIWITFFVIYITLQLGWQELQNVIMAFAVVSNAYVVLVCLFGPRIFITLFRKKQNTKWQSRRTTDGDIWENVSVNASWMSRNENTTQGDTSHVEPK